MRAMILLLVLLSWGSSLAMAAECPMGGHSAAGVEAEHGAHAHHSAPADDPDTPPARHAAECGVGMPCGVPALAAAATRLSRAPHTAPPETVRDPSPYASPDLSAEPPPPRRDPRF